MGQIIIGINWTAVLLTAIISYSVLRLAESIVKVARYWLEGMKTNLQIEKEISGRFRH